jgi:hydroxymethylbilane synthase
MNSPLRIGTRASTLALWQANHVMALLGPLVSTRSLQRIEIQTSGDQDRVSPLAQMGGIGVFTKEIQLALLDRRVDVAVHSLKDLPTIPVEGLTLAAVPVRGSYGDVFISRRYARLDDLPPGAVVGTSSLRRRAQILHHRPDLQLVDLRGNVETRLRKLDEQGLAAIILARAGLERLELAGNITETLDTSWMLPAVGQGALGLECRQDDEATLALLKHLDHAPTRQAVLAERAFLRGLGGGCLVPIGALAEVREETLSLTGAVLSPDGTRRIAGQGQGQAMQPEEIGQALARQLLEEGAGEVLGLTP